MAVVLEITREVALECHGDMDAWSDTNPKCQVRGIQVGWAISNGATSIAIYRTDLGTMFYPEQSLDLAKVIAQIQEWISITAPFRESTVNLPARAVAVQRMARREVQMET